MFEAQVELSQAHSAVVKRAKLIMRPEIQERSELKLAGRIIPCVKRISTCRDEVCPGHLKVAG